MAFSDIKRKGYNQTRTASQGATITLVSGPGYCIAQFECATRIAKVIGERGLTDQGDGMIEFIPVYRIPARELFSALQKLSKLFSVAIVEYDEKGFLLLWKIPRIAGTPAPETPSTNVDDY